MKKVIFLLAIAVAVAAGFAVSNVVSGNPAAMACDTDPCD